MRRKQLKILFTFFLFFLVGVGVWHFLNDWKDEKVQASLLNTKEQSIAVLNPNSHPEAGEDWTVSFETKGMADLTITPDGQQSIDELDFISLRCGDEQRIPQILAPHQYSGGDVIFYPSWQCDGAASETHLVNVAGTHTLEFQFGDEIAYAYNTPDSVTDTFTDETKIASKSNLVVTGGQVKLADVCYGIPNNTQVAGCNGTCQACQSGACSYATAGTDPGSQCTQGSTASDGCTGENCNGSGSCQAITNGEGGCPACYKCADSDVACDNYVNNTKDTTAPNTCTGTNTCCNDSGWCGIQTLSTQSACQVGIGNCTKADGVCSSLCAYGYTTCTIHIYYDYTDCTGSGCLSPTCPTTFCQNTGKSWTATCRCMECP